MEYQVLLNGENVTEFVPIPINEQKTLDESLNQGSISLIYTNISDAIKPFSSLIVNISEGNNTRKLSYFVSNDNKTEIIANGTFTHELSLIEQTKWLERFVINNRSIRNSLIRNYEGQIVSTDKAMLAYEGSTLWGLITTRYTDNTNNIPAIIEEGETVTFPSGDSIRINQYSSSRSPFTYPGQTNLYNYSLTVYLNGKEIAKQTDVYQTLVVNVSENGILEFEYNGWNNFTYQGHAKVSGNTQVVKEGYIETEIETHTITEAVNKLLEVAETIRESETPRFTFNQEQAEKYSEIEMPEMDFNGSLWECLKQIGDVIHSVPRLEDGVIYFDEFGSEEKCEANLEEYISNTENFSIENYASAIDSVVQNIVNTDDGENGAIVYPFSNGYITPRTYDTTAQITEDNMFIPTPDEIAKVIKVEVGYANGSSYQRNPIGDISQFVYEKSEYDMLSSFNSAFPNSKKYAIYYTEGTRNIYGLNFKLPNPVSEALEPYSINSILEKATGRSISQITNNDTIMNLMFRVTYIPMTEARLKQYKINKESITFPNTLLYNQTANKVNSNAYGEAMKGAIAKLGNPEVTKVYLINDLDVLNKIKVGTKFDDEYYISVVKTEYYKDFAKVSISLSKDFNAISEYVGIKNEIRYYEVAEKNTNKAFIQYEDFCIIGDNEEFEVDVDRHKIDNIPLLERFGRYLLEEDIAGNIFEFGGRVPSIARITTYLDTEIAEVILPITRLAIGNSIAYTVKFDDNYSAGQVVTEGTSKHIQSYASYTSNLGNVKSIEFDCGYMDNAGIWDDDGTEYDYFKALGNNLPYSATLKEMKANWRSVFNTNGDKIIIDKGSAEIPIITYQMHFVTNRKSLIVGSALARLSGLVKDKTFEERTKGCKLYVFEEELNQYTDLIDTSKGQLVGNIGARFMNDCTMETSISIDPEYNEPEGNFKSWAIVKDEQLIVGENVNFENIEGINMPFFNFTHII